MKASIWATRPRRLITYMRTDSVRINDDMVQAARDFITANYGAEYVPEKPRVYKTKQSSQDAHEAIRPTSLELTPYKVSDFLSRDQLRLYTLIWNRFLASQMESVETEHMAIVIESGKYELRLPATRSSSKALPSSMKMPKRTRCWLNCPTLR